MSDQDELRQRDGRATASRCPTRSARYGVDLDRALDARAGSSRTPPPTSSCTSSRAPCCESLDLPLGVVLGTYGVERHRVTWRGQAAHAGSTPMDKRRDALAGAAKLALELREIAAEVGEGAVCTCGGVVLQARHRHIGRRDRRAAARPAPPRRGQLAAMLAGAEEAARAFAEEEDIEVEWERLWKIEPILFDDELIELADESIREVSGARRTGCPGPAARRRRDLRARACRR